MAGEVLLDFGKASKFIRIDQLSAAIAISSALAFGR